MLSRKSLLAVFAALVLLVLRATGQTIVFSAPANTTVNSAGGTVTFTAQITYTTTPAVFAFSTTLPTGWSYLSGTNEPDIRPSAGNTGTLDWAFTTTAVPAGGFSFTFTASYPASLTGLQPLTSSAVTRTTTEAAPVTTPGPTVTLTAPPNFLTWVGDATTHLGSWTDATKWSPSGTVPNNAGLATYTAQLNSGTASIPTGTTITLNDLYLFGGSIDGGGALTLTGFGSSWTSGALSALSQVAVASGAALTASTYANHDFNQTTITNQGVFTWSDGGALRSGNGGAFVNASGGAFNDQTTGVTDYVITNPFGGTFTFSNAGTYVKSGGTSTTRVEVPFTNTGSLLISTGGMRFTSTFSNTGLFYVSSGAVATFDSAVTFTSGVIGGGGTLTGNVTIGAASGTIATVLPGNSGTGQLNVTGNLSLLATSTLLFELGGTNRGSDYDFLSVSGSVTLSNGRLALMFANNFQNTVSPATTFTLIGASSLTGVFSNVANGARLATTDGYGSFLVNYTPTGLTLSNYQVTPVPEPSTWALLLAGLGLVGLVLRRKK